MLEHSVFADGVGGRADIHLISFDMGRPPFALFRLCFMGIETVAADRLVRCGEDNCLDDVPHGDDTSFRLHSGSNAVVSGFMFESEIVRADSMNENFRLYSIKQNSRY